MHLEDNGQLVVSWTRFLEVYIRNHLALKQNSELNSNRIKQFCHNNNNLIPLTFDIRIHPQKLWREFEFVVKFGLNVPWGTPRS